MEDHIHTNGLVEAIESKLMPLLTGISWEEMELMLNIKTNKENTAHSATFIEIYTLASLIVDTLNISPIKSVCELTKEELFSSCIDSSSKAYVTVTSLSDLSGLFKLLNYDEHVIKMEIIKGSL